MMKYFKTIQDDCSHRLKIDKSQIYTFTDILKGIITKNGRDLYDPVLIKSNGMPTYMLASVVDDISINVDLIIRGDDHIDNTHLQNIMFKSVDHKIDFLHVPLILDESGSKISKRKNNATCSSYLNNGIDILSLSLYVVRPDINKKEIEWFFTERNKFIQSVNLTNNYIKLNHDKILWINKHVIHFNMLYKDCKCLINLINYKIKSHINMIKFRNMTIFLNTRFNTYNDYISFFNMIKKRKKILTDKTRNRTIQLIKKFQNRDRHDVVSYHSYRIYLSGSKNSPTLKELYVLYLYL